MAKRSDIVRKVAKMTGYSIELCETILDGLRDVIFSSLENGEDVNIKGFAKIEIKERSERAIRNPQTGNIETFPASKTVKCKLSKAVKEIVNKE